MEKITYHQLKPGEILDKLNTIDKTTLSKYYRYFTPGAHEILFYAYDNEKKCVAGFCSCVLTKDYDLALLHDEMYIRSLNVFNDKENGKLYREQGIGTKLLKEVAKYAKQNDYQRLTLMSLNEDSDLFYFGRGWVFYGFDSEMIKEVDDNIWLTACVMNECLNRTLAKNKRFNKKLAKNKPQLGDEVLKMLKDKSYDNILGYLEEPLHDTKYKPTIDFMFIDKKIQNLIIFDYQSVAKKKFYSFLEIFLFRWGIS